jgi:hypothetical protein
MATNEDETSAAITATQLTTVLNSLIKNFWKSHQVLDKLKPLALNRGGLDEISEVVPKAPGIYAIFRKDGRCFYVGSSIKSIRSRLIRHYGKDAELDYRGRLHELLDPDGFTFWFHKIKPPIEMEKREFKCLIASIEAVCSAAWNPEVQSRMY